VLGGSEGGGSFARDRAPRFASRGFAVLGLPYYSPGRGEREIPELPAAFADIPVALIFPEAGHALAGNGWQPTAQYNLGLSKVGGTPQANAAAQARAFPETIAFLKRTLRVIPQ
jgi:dienelactone hydrolase